MNLGEILGNNHIITLLALFLLTIFLIAGKQSIKAIINFIFSVLILYFVAIKGILNGNGIVMTILAVILISSFFFVLMNGFNKRTLTQVLSVLCGVIISGILAILFSKWQKILENEIVMNSVSLKTIHLIFSSVMIATFGICIDVVYFITLKLDEIKVKTEDFSRKELFEKGVETGKELIASKANILIFAYLGSGLLLVMLTMLFNENIIVDNKIIVLYMISALSGNIGVMLEIPITAGLYGLFNHRKTIYKVTSDNKIEGNRSLKIK